DGTAGEHLVDVTVEVVGDNEVRVTLILDVDYIFSKAIPGADDGTEVHASAVARAVGDGDAAGP
ncbi:MAG: hypothetical protein M3Z03_09140, partial [Actinomycetota bacterium]|nr:hypothetical protein [Actinomycetota bacterium]